MPGKRKTDHLITEAVNKKTINIDRSDSDKIVQLIHDEDKTVANSIYKKKKDIVSAIELIYKKLSHGGRLFIAGAGTSGRLGVLEAAECPPTFGTEPELVKAIIAGGNKAIWKSLEGAEDSVTDSIDQLRKSGLRSKDVLIGITASGDTPFVKSAIEFASKKKVSTILIAFNKVSSHKADILIAPIVGPEVIIGSTRMKAGTATKIILNTITTAVMIKLGKTYKNFMVDVQPKSEKLRNRAIRIVRELVDTSDNEAYSLLISSGWDVKSAVIMGVKKIPLPEARKLLEKNRGFLRNALS